MKSFCWLLIVTALAPAGCSAANSPWSHDLLANTYSTTKTIKTMQLFNNYTLLLTDDKTASQLVVLDGSLQKVNQIPLPCHETLCSPHIMKISHEQIQREARLLVCSVSPLQPKSPASCPVYKLTDTGVSLGVSLLANVTADQQQSLLKDAELQVIWDGENRLIAASSARATANRFLVGLFSLGSQRLFRPPHRIEGIIPNDYDEFVYTRIPIGSLFEIGSTYSHNLKMLDVFQYGGLSYLVYLESGDSPTIYVLRLCNRLDYLSWTEAKLSCHYSDRFKETGLSVSVVNDQLLVASNVHLCVFDLANLTRHLDEISSACNNGQRARIEVNRLVSGAITRCTRAGGPSAGRVCPTADTFRPEVVARSPAPNLYITGLMAFQAKSAFDMSTSVSGERFFADEYIVSISSRRPASDANYGLLFVVTSRNRLLKATLKSDGISFINVLFHGREDRLKSVYLSADGNQAFVNTEHTVHRLLSRDCRRHSTCSECVGSAADPSCSWCFAENKCSDRCLPDTPMLPNRQVDDRSKCPHITLKPTKHQTDSDKITVDVKFTDQPIWVDISRLQCSAVPFNPNDAHLTGVWDSFRNSCIIKQLNKTNSDQESFDYRVEVKSPTAGGLAVLASAKLTLFDCGVHRNCSSCAQSSYDCFWCPTKNTCFSYPRKIECGPGKSMIAAYHLEQTDANRNGEKNCPRFETPQTNYYFHSGVAQPGNLEVSLFNMAVISDNVDEPKVCLQLGQTSRTTCQPLPKESHLVSFDLTPVRSALSYKEARNSLRMPLRVVWQGIDGGKQLSYPIDDWNSSSIVLYKCEQMAEFCSDCQQLDAKYKCVWCAAAGPSASGDCRPRNESCSGRRIGPELQCPNPIVTRTYPSSGPIGGGTKLTILGKNLGRVKMPFNGYVNLETSAHKADCRVDSSSIGPDNLTCTTTGVLAEAAGSYKIEVLVFVDVSHVAAVPLNGNIPMRYDFVKPQLTDISPSFGIRAGGTILTFIGYHLDVGSSRRLMIGRPYDCDRRNVNEMVDCFEYPGVLSGSGRIKCQTVGPKDNWPSDERLSACLVIDNYSSTVDGVFTFVENPTISWQDVVLPVKTIQSGGTKLLVTGSSLANIQQARIEVNFSSNYPLAEDSRSRKRRAVELVSVDSVDNSRLGDRCIVLSNQRMSCFMPSMQVAGVLQGTVDAQFAIVADQLRLIPPSARHLSTVSVSPDPLFDMIVPNEDDQNSDTASNENKRSDADNPNDNAAQRTRRLKNDVMTLSGRRLNIAATAGQYNITAGQYQCNVTQLSENQLICEFLVTARESDLDRPLAVTVNVGYFTQEIGYIIRPVQRVALPIWIIVIIVLVVLFLASFTILLVVLLIRKNSEKERVKKKAEKKMSEYHTTVTNVLKKEFADMQTDTMPTVVSEDFTQNIPFLEYRLYCMKILFPNADPYQHPVVNAMNVPAEQEQFLKQSLLEFERLLKNQAFLLSFIRCVKQNQNIRLTERLNFASLLSIFLQPDMVYYTQLVRFLLSEMISEGASRSRNSASTASSSTSDRSNLKLLLRRTGMIEKLLSNWFTFLLYDHLRAHVGEDLFRLYRTIKLSIERGPIDAITGQTRFALNEDRLIKMNVEYNKIRLRVRQSVDQDIYHYLEVDVLDCDSISQVKEKVIDAMMVNQPHSVRDDPSYYNLVWLTGNSGATQVLRDIDSSSRMEAATQGGSGPVHPDYRLINTLAHYGVKSGSVVSLALAEQPRSLESGIGTPSSGPTTPARHDVHALHTPTSIMGVSPGVTAGYGLPNGLSPGGPVNTTLVSLQLGHHGGNLLTTTTAAAQGAVLNLNAGVGTSPRSTPTSSLRRNDSSHSNQRLLGGLPIAAGPVHGSTADMTATSSTSHLRNVVGSLNSSTAQQPPKLMHLVKPREHDQQETTAGPCSPTTDLDSSVFFTRMMTTKKSLQQPLDILVQSIFSIQTELTTVHAATPPPRTSTSISPQPYAVQTEALAKGIRIIKFMFDFLDDQARYQGIQDRETPLMWKSNCLPLRYWVNVIKNPNFIFDISCPQYVDSALTVVAQTFMMACSQLNSPDSTPGLSKDSPSSKLLFCGETQAYSQKVRYYYDEIDRLPRLSEEEFEQLLNEESKRHKWEFNRNAALYELLQFAVKNQDLIQQDLENVDNASTTTQLGHRFEMLLANLQTSNEIHL